MQTTRLKSKIRMKNNLISQKHLGEINKDIDEVTDSGIKPFFSAKIPLKPKKGKN